jgi:hypothetical protein
MASLNTLLCFPYLFFSAFLTISRSLALVFNPLYHLYYPSIIFLMFLSPLYLSIRQITLLF